MITSKSLWHFVALGLILFAPLPATAAVRCDISVLLAGGSIGQTRQSRADSRREAEGLLSRARQAIKAGNLQAAESLIAQAEQLQIPFSVFHLGDTPRKLRAELNAARGNRKQQPPRPSQKFTPELPSDQPAATTAAAPGGSAVPRMPTEVLDPKDEPPLALPQGDGRIKPLLAPLGAITTAEQELTATEPLLPKPTGAAAGGQSESARRQSNFHLLSARRALAVGDVRRATKSVEAARALGVQHGFHDDTPDKVTAAITKYSQVSEQTAGRQDEAARRQLADSLMDQAAGLLRWREYDEAERLVRHVQSLRVNYGPFELGPDALAERIAAARSGRAPAKQPAGSAANGPGVAGRPAAAAPRSPRRGQRPAAPAATRAIYNQQADPTRNRQTAAIEPEPATGVAVDDADTPSMAQLPPQQQPAQPLAVDNSEAMDLFQSGEQALQQRDRQRALQYFQEAYQFRDQLDPATAQRLQDHLLLLSAPPPGARGGKSTKLLEGVSAQQQLLIKQVKSDLAKKMLAVDKIRTKDPKRALEILKEARAAVVASGLDAELRAPLLRSVDRKVIELDKYIIQNRAKLELDEANREVLAEVDRRLELRLEIDDKLAELVDDFNELMDQERFAEAEVLAKRARELAPDNPIVKQLIWQSKFVSRTRRNQMIGDAKESGFWKALENADESAIPFDDNEPYRFGDARTWKELTDIRGRRAAEQRARRSERELEIERRLKTPVSLQFRDRPLSEVLDHLAKLAAVNLHLDPQGLEEEGVSSDTQVTIDLTQDISLKSALNLILEPLHLSYVIKDEVLKITSEQLRDGEVVMKTYDVADLVIPIPNFGPNGRTGMPGAIAEAYNMTGTGVGLSPGSAFLASQNGAPAQGQIAPALLAQINNQLMPGGEGMNSGVNQPLGYGPGGMGGGTQADFDSLIELITTTVKPTTWDEVGGPGSIQEFQNNLSLVISQTEDVHEEIVDLLEQLRRNQDLQVTIEVRFITLSDTFFERIGVDFDFNIVNSSANIDPFAVDPRNKREIVGLNPPAAGTPNPNFNTPSLAIPFRQESFDLAVPQFGTPVPVANFGFAILSDLEAFLLVQAAQGDRRSNVLQAPKVTLFNGQFAAVFDQTQQPFVISVIPVVGDFAAAYQPVITVLSEGTALTVQAIISHDRRFVRLTVLPLFSQIGDVSEFTFSGSSTTTDITSESESTGGPDGDSTASSDDATVTNDGVTVQLPNFSFVSVTTTVSVPDGGTVLLGGIKRLSEGRNEFGVPLLSKLPYINRLFTNVGIGRETQSLMMMVTPRIIIQEEEEERLGITTPP